MQKTINSVLRSPVARALILIVLIIPVSAYLGTSSVRRGFLYNTTIFAPAIVAAIAAGLWTYSWRWFWITLSASGVLTMLIQMSLYLVAHTLADIRIAP